jgi:hypothetical protein
MNQIAPRQEGGLSYKNIGIAQAGGGGMLLPQTFGDVVAFATMMARSQHAIPKHLRDNDGACMAITMQALRWEMDPFMVASKSYNVKDLIAYEAQIVAAVVNTRAPIKGRLSYVFEGEGDNLTCTVTGILDDQECVYTSPRVGNITTKNSPLWKSDPQQQLGYFSARSWARRHCPEVILGVYDRDEVEEFRGPDGARDVTPKSPVMERLQARAAIEQPASAREGFSASHVKRETESVLQGETIDANTGELTPNSNPGAESPPPAAGDDEDGEATSSSTEPNDQPPADLGSTAEPADNPEAPAAAAGSASVDPKLWLLNVTRMLWAVATPGGDLDVLKNQKKSALIAFEKPESCPQQIAEKADAVYRRCQDVINRSIDQTDALAIIAGNVGVDQDDILRKAEWK